MWPQHFLTSSESFIGAAMLTQSHWHYPWFKAWRPGTSTMPVTVSQPCMLASPLMACNLGPKDQTAWKLEEPQSPSVTPHTSQDPSASHAEGYQAIWVSCRRHTVECTRSQNCGRRCCSTAMLDAGHSIQAPKFSALSPSTKCLLFRISQSYRGHKSRKAGP